MSQTSDLPGWPDSHSSCLPFDPIYSSQLLQTETHRRSCRGRKPTENRTILLKTPTLACYCPLPLSTNSFQGWSDCAYIQHLMLSEASKPKLKHVDYIHNATTAYQLFANRSSFKALLQFETGGGSCELTDRGLLLPKHMTAYEPCC